MIEPEELMRLAVEAARRGIAAGQSPFGCAIARGDDVLSVAHNTVISSIDITAHAEVNAIRAACQKTGDILLEGCVVATTCEPCPMCTSALHWARVDTVYFGATIADAHTAGFNELHLSAADVLNAGGSPIKLVPGICGEDCRALFADWLTNAERKVY